MTVDATSETLARHPGLELRELLCFSSEQGLGGNRLAVVLGSSGLPDADCQAIAAELGHSETVFVDHIDSGWLRIYTPRRRMPFAGYPTIGAVWLLHRLGHPVTRLFVDAGVVDVGATVDSGMVEAPVDWIVPWTLIRVGSPAEVNAAPSDGEGRHDYIWAWADEEAGLVRARAMTSANGTVEDEATGSAAMALAAHVGREISIAQGHGSMLHAMPTQGGRVSLTGRVREA